MGPRWQVIEPLAQRLAGRESRGLEPGAIDFQQYALGSQQSHQNGRSDAIDDLTQAAFARLDRLDASPLIDHGTGAADERPAAAVSVDGGAVPAVEASRIAGRWVASSWAAPAAA